MLTVSEEQVRKNASQHQDLSYHRTVPSSPLKPCDDGMPYGGGS